jgi:hypothetical protein
MARTFKYNGEDWNASMTADSKEVSPGVTGYRANYTRTADGLTMTGLLAANDLNQARESDLISSLLKGHTLWGVFVWCPQGHASRPTFALPEILPVLSQQTIPVLCSTCGTLQPLSATQTTNLGRWVRGEIR